MEAGADCVLVSGVEHIQIVERLVHTMSGPLAISIAVSAAPNLDAYSAAGVACVTLGTSLLRSLLGNLRVKVHELASFGHFAHLDRAIPQDELEELLR
jgi:2-methylisocitrate lyase-like PEP mutase family enzyme